MFWRPARCSLREGRKGCGWPLYLIIPQTSLSLPCAVNISTSCLFLSSILLLHYHYPLFLLLYLAHFLPSHLLQHSYTSPSYKFLLYRQRNPTIPTPSNPPPAPHSLSIPQVLASPPPSFPPLGSLLPCCHKGGHDHHPSPSPINTHHEEL